MSNTVDKNEKVLEVKNLKKYFYVGSGKNKLVVPAVDGISFDVYKREVFGLVGESGCGKTTTGRTIIKLYTPTDGLATFNGVKIAAGYQTNLDNIRAIKAKLKKDMRFLKPNGEKIAQIEATNKRKEKEIEFEVVALNKDYKANLDEVEQPRILYKRSIYNARNAYKLATENIEYEINDRKKTLLSQTVNDSQINYNNEVKMAKHAFERSVDGLKGSAALHKEDIRLRLRDLKKEYDQKLIDLEEKYAPLIAEDEINRKDKKEIKSELDALKLEQKERKQAAKNTYNEELSKVENYDIKLFVKNKLDLKRQFQKDKAEKLLAIKELKKQTKEESNKLEKEITLTPEEKQELKVKFAELKVKADEDIALQRETISKVKKVNRSTEAKKEVTKMQMIFQDPISSLNPRMTVREIVSEGLIIQGELTKKEIDAKVEEALELVGLSPEFAARYPHEFSGGQRQRIGIARALVMNPDLVIADEPVSSLDVSIRAQVINLLTQLKDELGLTILFIAHDLSLIKFFCDRIAVMYYGKIVELATSEDLFKNPMHPYTISLLSAVPQPDPDYEKGRKRINYDPRIHDYRFDKPTMREIGEGHFVLANDAEFAKMKEIYKK